MLYAETFLTHWIIIMALFLGDLLLCDSCWVSTVSSRRLQTSWCAKCFKPTRSGSEDHRIPGLQRRGHGRLHRRWPKIRGVERSEQEMRIEFESVNRLEIPIKELRVWEHGDVAWYTMDIDYIRYEGTGLKQSKTMLPFRESGVLERRQGRWLLVQWHESLERDPTVQLVETQNQQSLDDHTVRKAPVDLSGEWEIQEADKTYHAVLDKSGSGNYTWQDGTFTTTRLTDGRWEGVSIQPGNDREGGFEVDLSEDRMAAHGRWWYTRVGNRSNIPARQWGGEYRLKRTQATSANHSLP